MAFAPLTTFSGRCKRCDAELPQERSYVCEVCDLKIEVKRMYDAMRDATEADSKRMAESCLPECYAKFSRTFGDLPSSTERILRAAQLLTDGKLPGIYLHGPAGSFKTSVAACALATAIGAGGYGRYVFVPDLLSDIHASYNGVGMTRDALVWPLVSSRYLVIDDLGKEKPSQHAADILFEIFDGRYRRMAPNRWMIVTSNWSIDGLCDRFAHLGDEVIDPIRRRLVEMTVEVPTV